MYGTRRPNPPHIDCDRGSALERHRDAPACVSAAGTRRRDRIRRRHKGLLGGLKLIEFGQGENSFLGCLWESRGGGNRTIFLPDRCSRARKKPVVNCVRPGGGGTNQTAQYPLAAEAIEKKRRGKRGRGNFSRMSEGLFVVCKLGRRTMKGQSSERAKQTGDRNNGGKWKKQTATPTTSTSKRQIQ